MAAASFPLPPEQEQEHTLKGNNKNNSNHEIDDDDDVSMFSDVNQCCYYLLEAMPLPGPTWSTTGPYVLAEQPPPTISSAPPNIEASSVGLLELGEKEYQLASSYTWWLGFLEGLDCNNMMNTEKLELPLVESNDILMEHSKGLIGHEPKFVDAIDLVGCCPDDWLMIPTMEKDLGDIAVP